MKTSNFEQYVNPTILDRGLNYYKEGRVSYVTQVDNDFLFIVEGTAYYLVELDMTDDELNMACDCPYDMGEYCKHEIAVVYYYNNEFKYDSKKSLEDLLSNMSKDELMTTLKNVLRQDPLQLKAFVDKKIHPVKTNSDVSEIKQYFDHDFFQYVQSAKNLKKVVSKTEELIKKIRQTDDIPSMIIRIRKIREYLPILYNKIQIDRSPMSEFLFSLSTFEDELLEIYASLEETKNLKNILQFLEQDFYDGEPETHHIIHYEILETLLKLSYDDRAKNLLDELISFIEENILRDFNHNFSDPYDVIDFESLESEHALFLAKYDKDFSSDKEAISKLKTHVDKYPVYIEYVKHLLADNQLKEAKSYLENPPETNLHKEEFHKLKVSFFTKVNDKKSKKKLLKEAVMNYQNLNWFNQYKALATTKEIENLLDLLVTTVKNNSISHKIYDIFLQEKAYKKLLSVIESRLWDIKSLYHKLPNTFKKEKDKLYQGYLDELAASASIRKDYRRVVHELYIYKKVSNNQIKPIVEKYKTSYSHKAAFIDELSKINLKEEKDVSMYDKKS